MTSSQTLGSATFGSWIPLNNVGQSVNTALGVTITPSASLTYSVQQTMDNVWLRHKNFSISRSTTTATVTRTDHGLSVGDWIKVEGAGAPLDGEYSVATVSDANTFTYTVANSGISSTDGGLSRMMTARVVEHATLTLQTSGAEGNYAFPPTACRLIISTYSSGKATLVVNQGRG